MSKPHVQDRHRIHLEEVPPLVRSKLSKNIGGVMALKQEQLCSLLVLLTSACSTQNSGLNGAPTEASTTQVPATTNGWWPMAEIVPGVRRLFDGSDWCPTRAGNAKTVGVHARWRMLVSQKLRCTDATHLHHQCRSVKRLSTGIFNLDNPANPFADFTKVLRHAAVMYISK